MTARIIAAPVGRIFVDDRGGDGPPLLFLHSLGGASGHWAAQLAHLRGDYRAIAMDLRGHGRSAAPESGDFSIAAYAADVDAVQGELGLAPLVVVGHSMGAAIAAAYAAAHPDRVAGLVLVDGAFARQPPTPEERTWLGELGAPALYQDRVEEHWNRTLDGSTPETRERVLGDLRRTSRETVATSFRELIDYDPLPAVRSYPGPATLILSEIGDGPDAAHHHVEALPHHRVDGTGHWLQLDRPAAVNALLDAFLGRPNLNGS